MKHKQAYYIRQYSFEDYRHGGVGYADAETILSQEGYRSLELPCRTSGGLFSFFKRLLYISRAALRVKRDEKAVFMFPVYARMNQWLIALLRMRGAKLICYIGDIDGLKDNDKNVLEKEIAFFRKFHYFIVHNAAMAEWLGQQIGERTISKIDFFDFLVPPVFTPRKPAREVVFAGNLAIRQFYWQLGKVNNVVFHVMGAEAEQGKIKVPGVQWHPLVFPQELPGRLPGSFGLLWDGDAVEELKGPLGNYFRYITSHKLSLYILAGMPVIVAEEAATAALVKDYKIGITVPGLVDLAERIDAITPEQYQVMQENLKPLAERISKGLCLRSALEVL
jgi:aromatic ring-cleaving dioxygenase